MLSEELPWWLRVWVGEMKGWREGDEGEFGKQSSGLLGYIDSENADGISQYPIKNSTLYKASPTSHQSNVFDLPPSKSL